ncbi:hemolysin D [Ferrigenium kumadai]|uniref:Hemolysin D n=1 Tax=Ferrigenium kumadai TaxID=1682490 RepID=A0AAN1T1A7_9PROT|nr:efflux RND transporter periplasmic adaptor subunit [Ferrigenium kumadai]BBJ00362.1 hemolysin D [Ferrigenium kumadai]
MSHIVMVGRGCLAVLLLLAMAGCNNKNAPPQPPPPEVSVLKLKAGPVTVYEEFAAQTEAVDTVEIRARVSGILERQGVADGARVKKGDLLFVIDQQPFIAALTQARANLAQAQASHVNSKQNLERALPLFADKAVSKQELDAAIAKEAADAASIESAKAQVEQASLNLGYTTLRAPRDGVMSKALVKQGGLVNASTTLLNTLYSEDPVYVNFTISDRELGELDKRLKSYAEQGKEKESVFRLKLADGGDYKYGGKLDFLDAAFDPKTGTLQVRISVPNPEHTLKSGQFVRVTLPAFDRPDAIRVPQKAVLELQGNQSVFVVGPDNKVVPRDITAKKRIDNDWIVERGLNAGELVVVEGIPKIRPGLTVKPVTVTTGQNHG